jgi:hypothetical protein
MHKNKHKENTLLRFSCWECPLESGIGFNSTVMILSQKDSSQGPIGATLTSHVLILGKIELFKNQDGWYLLIVLKALHMYIEYV